MAKEKTLVPVETYLESGIQVGTKFKTKFMQQYIHKVNPKNGVAILDLEKIDKKLSEGAKFLAKYKAEDILVVCRRENGWKAAKKFAKTIGAKYFVGRYPAGIITNSQLKTFMEPKLMFVADPRGDKNAVKDAYKVNIPILALCDSNNTLRNVDVAIVCNNKGAKSLGLVYWILTNEYLKAAGQKATLKLEDFIE
ncbi:MAG: 30S ribosomal protein S2 [Candidatus Nanoarchaeia archaeon]|jgi:small subunit ribosomal protein S2|nr:30S ribosomal protein S2 [Candidatus Nanoarchaeia archaeon]|tara:strand:- start:2389 stop:2973 length:585 start_codon:yes stop_codon:yes gene_type:complete